MSDYTAECPSCGVANRLSKPDDPLEVISQKLPPAAAAVVATAFATSYFGRIAGVIAATIGFGLNVVWYLDGAKVTCRSCGKQFHAEES